jgi:hypothetical protein
MYEAGKLYKTDHPITSEQTPHIPTPAKTKKRLMLLSIKAGLRPFIKKKTKKRQQTRTEKLEDKKPHIAETLEKTDTIHVQTEALPTNKILKYCSLNLKTNRIWCIVHIAEHKQI